MSFSSFAHLAPPVRLFCGDHSLAALGRELERLGAKRAAVICGSSMVLESAALDVVREALGRRLAGVVANVKAHSPMPAVVETAREIMRLQADCVIAVGGGSAIVTGRAASIFIAEGFDAHRLSAVRTPDGKWLSPRLEKPKLPQIVIPTTPTTACMKAGSAVFDSERGRRLAMYDLKTRAHAVFVHPKLVKTAPQKLVVSASMNALSMAVEGLESMMGNPISDGYLMQALRLLAARLPIEGRDSASARYGLVLSAILVGLGTEFGGGGLASVLGHAIGARHDTESGLLNAIVLPHTMRFNSSATEGRVCKVAIALGAAEASNPGADHAIAAVEALLTRLALPRRLRDVDVPETALDAIAEIAMDDFFVQKNPRPVRSTEDLLVPLKAAW